MIHVCSVIQTIYESDHFSLNDTESFLDCGVEAAIDDRVVLGTSLDLGNDLDEESSNDESAELDGIGEKDELDEERVDDGRVEGKVTDRVSFATSWDLSEDGGDKRKVAGAFEGSANDRVFWGKP